MPHYCIIFMNIIIRTTTIVVIVIVYKPLHISIMLLYKYFAKLSLSEVALGELYHSWWQRRDYRDQAESARPVCVWTYVCMSESRTRAGTKFKTGRSMASEDTVAQILKLLVEERTQREEALAAERALRKEELAAEKARRDEELRWSQEQTREQFDMMKAMMDQMLSRREDDRMRRDTAGEKIALTKLTDAEDIEAYLTTSQSFEVRINLT